MIHVRITPAYAGKSDISESRSEQCRDHPRLCGEKPFRMPKSRLASGSPPPMRGKVFVTEFVIVQIGITPAYAGKSDQNVIITILHKGSPPPMRGKGPEGVRYTGDPEDHPRLCGEKPTPIELSEEEKGSPPPMRGKAKAAAFLHGADRITPAYAGKSRLLILWYQKNQDHPRLCGEKLDCYHTAIAYLGSPPPMRGKAEISAQHHLQRRITPAYAGKSRRRQPATGQMWDHPRLCGEKRKLSRLLIFSLGSPPPMRGKVSETTDMTSAKGITPAYAGKSSRYRLISISSRDHPRLCGEKFHKFIFHKLFIGSPPPMRGKAEQGDTVQRYEGITPAYAGKSNHLCRSFRAHRDHPRLCGEKWWTA